MLRKKAGERKFYYGNVAESFRIRQNRRTFASSKRNNNVS